MLMNMDAKPPLLLENLARRKREMDLARERFEAHLRLCLDVHGTTEIARALGWGKPAISNRRRRLKEESDVRGR